VHPRNKCYFKIEWEIKAVSSVCLVSFVLNTISVSVNFSYPHRWHTFLHCWFECKVQHMQNGWVMF
jgi:hypothetical protein